MKNENIKNLEEMTENEKRAELLKAINILLKDAPTSTIVLVWELLVRIIISRV